MVFETVREPPETTNACWLKMLFTVCAPEEWVTVMPGPEPITTSLVGPGNAPVLQLVAVFQSPLPPIHVTVWAAAVCNKSRARPQKSPARPGNTLCFDILNFIQVSSEH